MVNKFKIIKSIISSKINHQPYKLNFAVTSACNSHCRTCLVWQKYQNDPSTINTDLKLEEITKIFKSLPENFVWLSLSGGEPFLRPDLVEICQSAINNIPSLCLISIPSNGLLTDLIVAKTKLILKSKLSNLFLNFSIDGPETIHNQIRGIPDAFKKTWSTYEKILALSRKNHRLAVNLEITISKYNLYCLEDFVRNLVNNGHKITATIAHTGYLYKNEEISKDFIQLNNHCEKLKRVINFIKHSLSITSVIDLVERIYLSKILEYYQRPHQQPLACIALKDSLAIDQKGNIIPCFMWGKVLGKISAFNYDLSSFQKKCWPEIVSSRELIRNEKCPNCWTPCEAYQSIINSFLTFKFSKII